MSGETKTTYLIKGITVEQAKTIGAKSHIIPKSDGWIDMGDAQFIDQHMRSGLCGVAKLNQKFAQLVVLDGSGKKLKHYKYSKKGIQSEVLK